jgi:selenocysteine lyase/cysteine desulfurase
MIPCQRHLFDIPDDVAYLNCAYMSPQLRSVTEAGLRSVALKAQPWGIAAEDFFEETERTRGLFAQLIGSSAEDVSILPAVSYGMAVAAANVRVAPGNRIAVLADQFPSHVYPWLELSRERGATLVTVPRPRDRDWTAALLTEVDERTAVVAVPHCHWTDGGLLDLKRVGERCRETGSALVLDLTQSLGALSFSAAEIRPDFAVAAAYKWLLGPYSIGFMYVDPTYHEGRPLENNWINRKHSEDFAGLVNYRDEFQPGARRFDVGERTNFALMPMAAAALEQILNWGVPEIETTLSAMADQVARRAEGLGFEAAPAHLRAGHLLGLRRPGGVPADLLGLLAQEKVFVSVRGDSIRVSPHLYNTPDDLSRFLGVLGAVL